MRPLLLALLPLCLLTLSACTEKEDDTQGETDADTDADADTDTDTDADADTDAPPLTPSHGGWQDPCCFSCHTADGHNTGLQPFECVACHGPNGASAGHGGNTPCADCHDTPHDCGDSQFPDPTACQTCHP